MFVKVSLSSMLSQVATQYPVFTNLEKLSSGRLGWMTHTAKTRHSQVDIFKSLSNQPRVIDEVTFNRLCSFVYSVYGLKQSTVSPFKSQRTDQLIQTPDVNLRSLVPSPSGILQQIKRACIQAGYLWKLCDTELTIPDPEEWGWKRDTESTYIPRWQDEAAVDISSLLSTCSCTKGVCTTCSCNKADMKCLTYCKCMKQKCKNY